MRTHDGLDLFVRVDGPDTAPVTVVMLHGWTVRSEGWHYQIRDLLSRYGHGIRIVSYDHRGHGRSEAAPRQACTIANLGRDAGDVIDSYAPTGRLILAGHSMGGMSLMALAEQRPELIRQRVDGVLFASSSAGDLNTVTLGLPDVGARLRERLPYVLALRSRMLSVSRRRQQPFIERTIAQRILFGQPRRLADVALAVDSMITTPSASMTGFYDSLMRHRRVAALSAYDGIPTRVLVGTHDNLTPPVHSRVIAQHIDGARLTLAPGAGHYLPLERDQLVSDRLCELNDGALTATTVQAAADREAAASTAR